MSQPAATAVRAETVADLVDVLAGQKAITTVLLDGPGGIGKSWLASAVADELRRRGTAVRTSRATEASLRNPFGLVATLLGLPTAPEESAGLADAALARVEELTVAGPLLLVVDDAQYCDADSLAALWRLSTAGRDLPVRLLITRRRYPEREVLSILGTQPQVAVRSLEPLSAADIDRLAGEFAGAAPGPRLRSLLARTDGSPLHVAAVIRSLNAQGRLSVDSGVAEINTDPGDLDAPPPSVSVTIARRLDTLSDRARELARLLAVLGRPATPAELADMQGVAVLGMTDVLGESVGSGVLSWTADGALDFGHDIVRDVVYQAIPDQLRRVMHRGCADYLRRHRGSPTAIAYHVERSAGGEDSAAIAGELRLAANDSPPGMAAELLASAANVSGSEGNLADEVAIQRTRALFRAGRIDEAAAVAETALEHAGPHAAGGLYRVLALSASVRGRVDELAGVVDRALADPRVAGHARDRLGQLREWNSVLAGRFDPATPVDPAIRVRSGSGASPVSAASAVAMMTGNGVLAITLAERAADGHSRLSGEDDAEMSSVDVWPVLFRLYTYGARAASADLGRWRSRTADRAEAWVDPFHQLASAGIAQLAGRSDDAAAEFDAALEAVVQFGSGWISQAVALRCELHLDRGEIDAAATLLRHFRSLNEPPLLGQRGAELIEARLLVLAGHAGQATAIGAQAWEAAAAEGNRLWFARGAIETLDLALMARDFALLTQIAAGLRQLDATLFPAAAPIAALACAADEGDATSANRAADDLLAIGNARPAALTRALAARIAALSGDGDLAKEVAQHAREELFAIGATARVRGETAALRDLGVVLGVHGKRNRPSLGWDSLTPTESSIVGMIGDGRTGPEIARALFISPRTVQTHVSHALHKLGMATRMELASAVAARRV